MRSKRVVGGIAAVCVVAVLAAVWWLAGFVRQPAQGVIAPSLPEQQPADSDSSGPGTLSGTHFSLTYPALYSDTQDITASDRNALEAHRLFSAADVTAGYVIVTIKNLPAGGAPEDSGYRLRIQKSSEYRQTPISDLAPGAVLFEALGSNEAVLFVPGGGKLAILAVSASGNQVDTTNIGLDLLEQFVWRR